MSDPESLVGRGPALARVGPLIDAVAAGRGGVLLVTGEPGIGKTRFVSEAPERLSDNGVTVVWGRCQEMTASQAYWPWLQALRAVLDESLVKELLPRPMWSRMFRMFPEFQGLAAPDSEEGQDESQIVMFDALRQLLMALAARHPVAFVLEDVHWADDGSLRLVEFLAPELGAQPVALVVSYREQEALDHLTLRDVVGGLSSLSNGQRVRLERLTLDDTRVLLELELDDPASMDGPMVAAVHRRTAGNPFFIRHVAQMLNLQDAGGDLSAVPPAVQDAIERRLSRLDHRTRRFLEAAAVWGSAFQPALVDRIDQFEADLSVLLEDAEDRELVEPDPATSLGYRFVHHLVWEAVYEAIGASRRASLHARAAEQLERMHADGLAEHLSMIASHLERAGATPEPERALELFVQAGEQVLEQRALESARRWFGRAVEIAQQQGKSRELLGLRARLGAAFCDTRLGEPRRGVELLQRVAYDSLETGDAEFIGRAVPQFLRIWGPFTGNLTPEDVMPLLEQALVAVGRDAGAARARLLIMQALQLLYFWEEPNHLERARETAHEAIEIARESGSEAALVDVLAGVHRIWWEPQYDAFRTPLGRELIELARELDRVNDLLEGILRPINFRFERGELVITHRERDELEALQRRMPNPSARAFVIWRDVARLALGGAIDQAREALQRGERDPSSNDGSAMMQLRWAGFWLSLARHDGGSSNLGERMQSAFATAPALERELEGTSLDSSNAYFSMIEGDLESAVRAVAKVVDSGFVRLEMDQDRPAALAMMAEVCVELGDQERGAAVYDQLVELRGINPLTGVFGSTWRHLALLSQLCGKQDRARDEFERALESNGRMGPGTWTGLAQADYADLLSSTGDPEDAGRALELYRAAAEIAERQAAPMLADRCRSALKAVVPVRAKLPDGLTRREAEIARMIADGMANKEIADVLVLSVRTIERHITNLYGKIDARGRADVATYVLQHDLVDPIPTRPSAD